MFSMTTLVEYTGYSCIIQWRQTKPNNNKHNYLYGSLSRLYVMPSSHLSNATIKPTMNFVWNQYHHFLQVLNLLSIAWERRLVFTIGRSVTTGREDVVTWSGVEHRTERGQFSAVGETALFLERVIRQLNMRGVSDGQDEQGLYQELS